MDPQGFGKCVKWCAIHNFNISINTTDILYENPKCITHTNIKNRKMILGLPSYF